jgi:hypothetical protein
MLKKLLPFIGCLILCISMSRANTSPTSLQQNNQQFKPFNQLESLYITTNQSQPQKLNGWQKFGLKLIQKKINRKIKKINTEGRKVDGLGVASFTLGILAWFIFGIPFSILAMIFGLASISRINKSKETRKGKGFAIVGLILGLIALIFIVAVVSASGV